MPEQTTDSKLICPFLGLPEDRDARFLYPEKAHLCYAAERAASISLEHQSTFCLTQHYSQCPRFVVPADRDQPASTSRSRMPHTRARRPRSLLFWVVAGLGLLGIVAAILFFFFYHAGFTLLSAQVTAPTAQVAPSATPTLTATQTPTVEFAESTPTPGSAAFLATPTATATPLPGDRVYTIVPPRADIGWVASGEEQGNHLGDSYLYAGVFEGQVYNGALQFDLSAIPRGAPIHYAAIHLTGLRADRLGSEGTWTLRLLSPEIDADWRRHSYQDIFNAPALHTLSPILESGDLAEGQTNIFELSPAQIGILETRIIQDEAPRVSFRLDGPLTGTDNLFAWDTGYGPQSRGAAATLILSVGPPPATPPPYNYLVVTSTPTPENVLTAAAVVLQMTADAASIGTTTPVPPNVATATQIPDYLIIVPTLTPGNEATAQALVVIATAQALTTGTPTLPAANAVTATPIPTATPTATYILITATPTPESIFVAATLSAASTAQARTVGTATPLPDNWVTPIVVTSTPTPANFATAQIIDLLATVQAFTTGTPTPTPANVVTATPTPVFILLDGELPPMTPTPTPTLNPRKMPPELIGKIAFKSNRSGQEEIYLINPDGSGLALLTDRWPYQLALDRDVYSSDQRFRVFVKDAIINTSLAVPIQVKLPAIFFYDALYNVEEQVTRFNPSLIGFPIGWATGIDCGTIQDELNGPHCLGLAYEPAWSPTAEKIAFVSNDSGNDEIWVANRDGSDTLQLTRDDHNWWDKHPSWSPDGSQIVFWSNRTGNWQIWVMNVDGSNLYSLSRTGFNDWDPVWIKYPDMSGYKP
jgi:hypothetical protein